VSTQLDDELERLRNELARERSEGERLRGELVRSDDKVGRLERDNALLLAAIEASPAGILIASAPDGTIRVANSASLGIRGESKERLVEIPVELHPSRWQTFHADGRPYAAEDLPLSRALLRGEVINGYDVIIRRPSGEDRWVSGHAAPVYQDGKLIAGVVVFPDITERKLAEAELARFRAMAELTTDFVGMADSHGRFLYLNPAALRLLGLPADTDVAQLDLSTLYYSTTLELIERGIQSAQEHDTWTEETRLRVDDGSEIPVSQVISAHRGVGGEIEFYSTIMRDLRPIRALEEQLLHSQKLEAIGRLAGGVAHDFNNLLTVVVGANELAQLMVSDPEVLELLHAIQDATARASRLTTQLLAFARRQIIEPKVIDPAQLFVEVEGLLGRLLGESIHFRCRIAKPLYRVRIDVGQFEQVLVNLAINAKEAMPHGGTLTISASNETISADEPGEITAGDYVKICVEDSGEGMSAGVRERVFEPFFTTKGQGSGLGLATVHGVIKQNHGHVRVESTVGVGTRFDIWLPRCVHELDTSRRTEQLEGEATGSARILLVEDEEQVRILATQILELAGHQVTSVTTGEAGIEAAEATPPDVLVTDVVLPGIAGSEVAAILRIRQPELAVLFTSGYAEDVIAHHGVLEGDVRFLAKPYTPEGLRRAVAEALARRLEGSHNAPSGT
jgi:two-component system cell cycle sensor histidine kinase/response regulator CckA